VRTRAGLSDRAWLGLIVLVALLVRLPAALYMGDEVAALPGTHDQVSYDALARSLLAGRGFSFGQKWYPFTPANTPTAHWSFPYPLYLAGVYSIFGDHPLAARLIQGLAGGGLMCCLAYLIGRRVADRRTGLAAAALTAVYGYFVYYNVALMTETFFMASILTALYLSLAIRDRPSLARWLGLGLALGLAGLLRQTALLLIPLLLAWLVWELRRKAVPAWHFALPLVVVGLLVAPWTIRNARVYGRFLLLNSNAGYALYASNHPDLGTDWRNEEVVVPIPPDLLGRNEAELSDALAQRAIGFILADPGRYLLLTLNKSLEFFQFWPTAESGATSNLNRVLSFGVSLPFMLLGLGLSLARWRRWSLLYLFAAAHSGLHLLSWPAVRYRLPVDAVLLIFAGLALNYLAAQLAAARRKLPPAYRLAPEPEDPG
jgi:4-amino-4-deoxy-L-arabinose transferase-like glycosyltransferase